MAVIDWPADRVFAPRVPDGLTIGLSAPETAWTSPWTGQRTAISHNVERLRLSLTLPPCEPVDAGRRESLINELIAMGHQVRLHHFQRPAPAGTLRGAPVLAAAVAAGARSISLEACTGTNLLLGGSFEFDTNGDGVADGWAAFSSGAVSGLSYGRTLFDPSDGVYEQYVTAASVGVLSTDAAGIYKTIDFAAYPGQLTASVRVRGFGNVKAFISAIFQTAGGVTTLGSAIVASAVADGTPVRIGGAFTPPAGTQRITISIYIAERTGADSSRTGSFDAVSVAAGDIGAGWPGRTTLLGGDMLGLGGRMLQVGYQGATADDAGRMTVPLALAVRAAGASGAAVGWDRPTDTFQLQQRAVDMVMGPSRWQRAVTLSFLQVA